MESFYALDWSRKTPRPPAQQFDFYNLNISDDETDIFYNHLNEIDPIHHQNSDDTKKCTDDEEEIDIPIDPRTQKPIEKLTINHRYTAITASRQLIPRLFNKFPTKSTMTSIEHSACINAISRFYGSANEQKSLDTNDRGDQEVYFRLAVKRATEKEQFDVFVKQYFNAHLTDRYRAVDDDLLRLAHENRYKTITTLQESNRKNVYVLQSSLPNAAMTTELIDVKFEKYFCRTGMTVCCSLPDLQPFVHTVKVADGKTILAEKLSSLNNDPLVWDAVNGTEGVDLVCSISSLYCLINSGLDSWTAQVFVRLTDDGKKIVVVEKPLPKINNSVECNRLGHKWAVKQFLRDRSGNKMWSLETDTIIEAGSCPPVEEANTEDVEKNTNIEWRLLEFEEYMSRMGKRKSSTNDFVYPKNASYGVWKVSSGKCDVVQLMIRTKQDGSIESSSATPDPINLSTKLEYKVEFGSERMTVNELIKEWCHMKFHHDTITLRFRIDVTTSRIVSRRRLTLQDIETELKQRHKITPSTLLQNLWTKVEILKKFPIGEYVLRKDADSRSGNISIYRRVDDTQITSQHNQNTFNLTEYLTSLKEESPTTILLENFEQFYCEIDENEVTAVHRQSGTMPATFPHWLTRGTAAPMTDDKRKFTDKFNAKRKVKETAIVTKKLEKKRKQREAKQKRRRESRAKEKQQNVSVKKAFDDDYDFATDPIEFDAHGNVRVSAISPMTLSLPVFEPVHIVPSSATRKITVDEYARQANVDLSSMRPIAFDAVLDLKQQSPQGEANKIFGLPMGGSGRAAGSSNRSDSDATDDDYVHPARQTERGRNVEVTGRKKISRISKLRQSLRVPKLDKSYF